jgi:hypothetical protein
MSQPIFGCLSKQSTKVSAATEAKLGARAGGDDSSAA